MLKPQNHYERNEWLYEWMNEWMNIWMTMKEWFNQMYYIWFFFFLSLCAFSHPLQISRGYSFGRFHLPVGIYCCILPKIWKNMNHADWVQWADVFNSSHRENSNRFVPVEHSYRLQNYLENWNTIKQSGQLQAETSFLSSYYLRDEEGRHSFSEFSPACLSYFTHLRRMGSCASQLDWN